MKTEYELISDFSAEETGNIFYALHIAISQKNWDLLDLEACSGQVNEALRAVACKKRFDYLNAISCTAIKYSVDGFLLDNHKFETLDEVERAWKLKAFI